MHVACLTKAYAHPNEPCYLNTLYVPEVCRVHSTGQGNWAIMTSMIHVNRGQMFARVIVWGIHPSLLIVEKYVQIMDLAQVPILYGL